ncbi:helix-turn-helix domain-containing protein (plasmid) [Tistrella mobilis]|uniref:helix-turn-helix domain-containing protein n=1 Tax=Tistrella mobilis TaxID=171437 RepID=UPI0035581232
MTLEVPSDPFTRSAWIVMQLRLHNTSLADIAREHGWSRSVVSQALRTPLYAQEVAIAGAIGLTPRELFAERYDPATGVRRHLVKSSAQRARRNVEGRGAKRHASGGGS